MSGQYQESVTTAEYMASPAEISRIDTWIETHPYLKEFADLHKVVEAITGPYSVSIEEPDWELYAKDYADGIPILKSGLLPAGFLSAAEDLLKDLVIRLQDSALPERFTSSLRALSERMAKDSGLGMRIIDGTVRAEIDESASDLSVTGMELYLGWKSLERIIRPMVNSFTIWRDESKWNRGYCPTCGSSPGTALLVGSQGSRVRHLACGLCHTKWSFRRLGCPYCGNVSPEGLEIFELEDEPALRLDVCNQCKGYLKTCTDESQGDIVIQDWTTLHLDVVGRSKGYKRIGATLYEL